MPTASNAGIRTMDVPIIDTVFGMEHVYALNFSNRTFASFSHEELGVDIYPPPCLALPSLLHQGHGNVMFPRSRRGVMREKTTFVPRLVFSFSTEGAERVSSSNSRSW